LKEVNCRFFIESAVCANTDELCVSSDVSLAVIFNHSVATSNSCLHLNRPLLARSYTRDVTKKAMICMLITLFNCYSDDMRNSSDLTRCYL